MTAISSPLDGKNEIVHSPHSMRRRLLLFLFSVLCWGGIRAYYRLTDGFREANIRSSYAYHPGWETRAPTEDEARELTNALNQPYEYLGKGCQSYVFASQDGQYVIKFFKFQRYRVSLLQQLLPPLRLAKEQKKEEKRERFFQSWKLAYDELANECGLLCVHLNRTNHLKKTVSFKDKLGLEHSLPLDELVFLVQKKGVPLEQQHWTGEELSAFCERLVALLLDEYQRGFFDADPALLQNTGVLNGAPIHLDVGQWKRIEDSKTPDEYKQNLYDRLHTLHSWLQEKHPSMVHQVEESFFVATETPWERMHPIETGCY